MHIEDATDMELCFNKCLNVFEEVVLINVFFNNQTIPGIINYNNDYFFFIGKNSSIILDNVIYSKFSEDEWKTIFFKIRNAHLKDYIFLKGT